MCRAVWVIVVGVDDAAAKRLRRAAGAEAQIVAIASTAGDADAALGTTADVLVLDGSFIGAHDLARRARESAPDMAVLWVGAEAPDDVHHAIDDADDLSEILPGAITRALILRRR